MKNRIEYNNIVFDSEEELLVYYYLQELKDNNFIDNFIFHPESILLSSAVSYKWIDNLKTKNVEKENTILREHIYTYDYEIIWNIKSMGIFYYNLDDNYKLDKIPFIAQNNISKIEVKPAWDMQNMTRLFSINSKWVFDKYGILIYKVIPTGKNTCLFAKTFVPQKALFTKKKKQPKKFKYKVRTLQEFINGNIESK